MTFNPVYSVIKNEAPGLFLCVKHPTRDFNVHSKLIVNEYEEAIFIYNGKIFGVFEAGKYDLETESTFMSQIKNIFLSRGQNQFSSEVFFVNKAHHLDLKWGTKSSILVTDPIYKYSIPIFARGAYTIKIFDSKTFCMKLVANNANFSEQDVMQKFRILFMQHITDSIAEYIMNQETDIISSIAFTKTKMADGIIPIMKPRLSKYGLDIEDFHIEFIELDKDDPNYRLLNTRKAELAASNIEIDIKRNIGKGNAAEAMEVAIGGKEVKIIGAEADIDRLQKMDETSADIQRRVIIENVLTNVSTNPGAGGVASAGAGVGMAVTAGSMTKDMIDSLKGTRAGSEKYSQDSQQNRFKMKSQIISCPVCNASVSSITNFCPNCGEKMIIEKIKCPYCNTAMDETARFCPECGKRRSET